jgi:hypothetical protein
VTRSPPLLVGQAEDRAVLDGGMSEEHLLDLGGVDVEAAGDDHVLGAADELAANVVRVLDTLTAAGPGPLR